MKTKISLRARFLTLAGILVLCLAHAGEAVAQTINFVNLNISDLAYSDYTKMVYASIPGNGTLVPVNPLTLAVGTPISISNLSGRICASDGGYYLFAALNGATNHICQFDLNLQSIANAWSLDGTYVEDMVPVIGSSNSITVSRRITNSSPRGAGVVVYDNGVARTNTGSRFGFFTANVIEPGRTPDRLYGYVNEVSPAQFEILKLDGSGVTIQSGWGALQGFGVDITCRGGWVFATTGQIFDQDRGLQVGTFPAGPVSGDAASRRVYLINSGALYAYDETTLQQVGADGLGGMTSATGPMIPWGTNGFAVRVSSSRFAIITTPLISTGAATDLRVSLTAPTLPIPAGSNYTYTLVVTNAGPNSAVNVALAQTFPTNASYITSVASSGSSILGIGLLSSGNGLVTFFGSIASGSSRTVTVTMHSLKPGLLASVASVSSNAKDSNPSNNVVRIQLPVGSGLFPDRVVELALPSADLAWDKFSGRIFASVPNADWLLGNGILALNPTNGNFDPRIPTDLEPYKLAVADNGQYLYAGINGDISVQRVNIASRTVDLKFPTGFNNVADMAVLPATPHSIAVTAHTTFAVYDDGVRRTNVVAPGPYNFEYYLAVSDTNTLAYAGLPDELRRIAINASGATLAESTSLISGFDRFIRFDAGRLYTAGGRVIDPVSKVVVTNLPYGGLVCPDSQKARVFYLTVSGTTGTLHGINISNFSERGTVTVTNVLGGATSLIRWGLDGLAFRTSANQLFLIRTTLADDVDDDGMADTWETANFGSTNAATGHAGDDPDHDGMNNLAEFIAGTSPNDSNSVLRITSSSRQTNGVLLNWKGGTNMNHFVQRTQSLNGAPVWQDIYTNPPSAVSTNSFLDTSASNNSANFYRIRVTGQ